VTGPVRVVLAKPGLDGHESGVMLVGRALRDAGMEVVYLGPRQRPGAIAQAVVQEDADVLGLSVLTGGHLVHARRVLEALRDAGAGDVPVVLGGIIPESATAELRELGIAEVFGPGDALTEIVSRVRAVAQAPAAAER
jgi:methylmalonyl-CoA mutase C-terminal domain/subunit